MRVISSLKNSHFFLLLTLLAIASKGFSQSDSCAFFGNKPIFPYYYPTSPNNGKDFYTIKRQFKNTITDQTNFTGIITINFFINYKGETNFYNTQVCDENYRPLAITTNIQTLCAQALTAVKETSPWKPALDENRNPVNSRKFYSFRFINGTLSEILPK